MKSYMLWNPICTFSLPQHLLARNYTVTNVDIGKCTHSLLSMGVIWQGS